MSQRALTRSPTTPAPPAAIPGRVQNGNNGNAWQLGATPALQTAHTYDSHSRLSSVSMGPVSATYGYEGGGTVVRSVSRPMAGSGALHASIEGRLTRDPAGRLRTMHWSRASSCPSLRSRPAKWLRFEAAAIAAKRCPSLRSRPAKWLCFEAAAIAAMQWGGGHVYGSITYQHDAAGRRVRATDERNLSWRYAYNSRGEPSRGIRRRDRQTGSPVWGAAPKARVERLSQLMDAQKTTASGAALPGWAQGYAYDDIGNRTQVQTQEGQTRSSTPNDLNQIASRQGEQSRWLRGRAPVSATVSVSGQTAQRSGEDWRFLLESSNASLLRQREVTVSSPGETAQTRKVVFSPATAEPDYDADGNLLFDGRWYYAWDAENRLKGMQSAPVAQVNAIGGTLGWETAVKLEFAYDGLGRRIWKKVSTAPGNSTGSGYTWTEQESWLYVWQDWRLLGEYRWYHMANPNIGPSGWRLRRSYLWGMDLVSGVYDRRMSENGAALNPADGVGGLLWVLDYQHQTSQPSQELPLRQLAPWYDGNGNITGWIENNAVLVKALRRQEYDPFGRLLTIDPLRSPYPLGSGEDPQYDEFPPFGFSTKFEDVETGHLNFGYRIYLPELGVWPSRDPIGERGGLNLYGVCRNDPVNRFDVLGKYSWAAIIGTLLEAAGLTYDAIKTGPTVDDTIIDFYGGPEGFMDATERELAQYGTLPVDMFKKARAKNTAPINPNGSETGLHDRLRTELLASKLYKDKKEFILKRLKEGTLHTGFVAVNFRGDSPALQYGIGGGQLHYKYSDGPPPMLELRLKDTYDFTNKGHVWGHLQNKGYLAIYDVEVLIEEIPCPKAAAEKKPKSSWWPF